MTRSNDRFETVVSLFLAVLISPFTLVWNGFVGKTVWNWYAVEIGLPRISLVTAIGLGITISFFVVSPLIQQIWDYVSEQSPIERLVNSAMVAFIAPALTLLFASIVHLFA